VDVFDVERRLVAGAVRCPGCGGVLARWGHARARVLRDLGSVRWRLRPRRGRCSGCGVTQVLVPVGVLVRRADTAAVVFAGLAWAAAGWGHRRIAAGLGRPEATVRGWLRRLCSRAGPVAAEFTALWCALEPSPPLPGPALSPVGDVLAAIDGAAAAVGARFGVLTVTPSGFATAVTHAGLLAPSFIPEAINTSRLW
jgi:hypothetical protein